MKIYQSHKKVTAARITGYGAIEPREGLPFGMYELTLEDSSQVQVVGARFDRVQIGGFYVRADDGHDFYVPAERFANSYMEVGEAPDALAEPAPKVLAPHQQRVVDEKADLDEKLTKLLDFIATEGAPGSIFDKLPIQEQDRLTEQGHLMRAYSAVLGYRIAAF